MPLFVIFMIQSGNYLPILLPLLQELLRCHPELRDARYKWSSPDVQICKAWDQILRCLPWAFDPSENWNKEENWRAKLCSFKPTDAMTQI